MDPLPMIASCTLQPGELGRQVDRYRRLGANSRILSRDRRSIVLELADAVDPALVTEVVETERECCPFFTLEWDAEGRRLGISVSVAENEPALDAIAFALGISADGDAAEPPRRGRSADQSSRS